MCKVIRMQGGYAKVRMILRLQKAILSTKLYLSTSQYLPFEYLRPLHLFGFLLWRVKVKS